MGHGDNILTDKPVLTLPAWCAVLLAGESTRLTSVNEELVGDARMIDIVYRAGKYGSKNL